jgi:hypothetical protein
LTYPFDEDSMNALLIHDLTAAIERDAELLSATDQQDPYAGAWASRRRPSTVDPDELLEQALEQLRQGPPSLRRR